MSQEINKKYIILENEKIENNFGLLYRIQAIKDFGDVKVGDKGGWVESERNLSQLGNCWIYDESVVYGGSHVGENAKILNYSEICDYAHIWGNAIIERNSSIGGEVFIKDAKVTEVDISDCTQIIGDFEIKSARDFYTFKIWLPYNEYVTYIPNHNKFSYCSKSYTKEELAKNDDFGQESGIILETLNKIIDLCNYYKKVYH